MDHLLKQLGFLEFSASNVVSGPMQWGPARKIARKGYDPLGLHGKVSLPQSVNWSKTKALHHDPLDGRARLDQPRRARARRHRRPARLRAHSRPGHGRARLLHRPSHRAQARQGDLLARGGPQGKHADTEADEMEEHLRGLGYLE